MNICIVAGRLSRPAERRSTPSGDSVVTFDVTVPADPKADSVPISWFDPPAWAGDLDEGEEIVVVGRVHRRFWRTGGGVQSRTDVLAESVVKARRVKRATALLDRTLGQIEEAVRLADAS